MSAPSAPTGDCDGSFLGLLNCAAGSALDNEGRTIDTLVASIAGSFTSLGVQLLVFIVLRLRLSRIYRPRSYLVPERERVPPPPGGVIGWLYPLFSTSNLTLIQKCGLDAYFFLRFLRMMLKIFLPTALLVLPILLPLNNGGGGLQIGLDKLSITNIGSKDGERLWAHCILAIIFIIWVLYVVFKEFRGYIRVRQAYLTSPQHRIRASATTVLVTGIPRKWLTMEALSGLYDVFPGGIRNIWINRNFDELADKVDYRNQVARNLEDAETVLVKLCRKKHLKAEKKRAKEAGQSKSRQEKKQDRVEDDATAERMASGEGTSAGETHNVPQGVEEILEEGEKLQHDHEKAGHNPFGAVGKEFDRLGQGFGKGAGKFGEKVAGEVDHRFRRVGSDPVRVIDEINTGGFVPDDTLYHVPTNNDSPLTPRMRPHQEEGGGNLQAPRHHTDQSQRRPSASSDTKPRQTRHPLNQPPPDESQGSPSSDNTLRHIVSRGRRSSSEYNPPQERMEIEEPATHQSSGLRKPWDIFKNQDRSLVVPSPQPHVAEEEDEFPLHVNRSHSPAKEQSKTFAQKLAFWKSDDESPKEPEEYPCAYDKDWDEDQDEEPYWRRYIEPKDRETMRLPLFSPTWFPGIPLIGKKVDRIYHLRRELARLNLEIETDQNQPEKFPYMNSAFIQFNHQVAAHMCCQSLSHHIPQQMAPRLVEISPEDVIWANMSMKWWERYLRSGVVLLVCAGLVILYAVPVAFTSILNKVSTLAEVVHWLSWLTKLPPVAISIIQGILPPVLLSVILLLVPMIFRLLITQQGVPTGNDKELGVQTWYFAFLFIQVFLVVTISNGLLSFFRNAASDPGSIVRTLSENLPKASNYFFTYLTVQSLSNSASALLQVGALLAWFVLAPVFDSTARAKWARQTSLNNVQWGTFFPPFTNFAVIGLVYSIISPIILVFMLFIFGLFWIVYRYNVLYVYQFRHDTGGLLFPVALNQLFVGIYCLELCLIGLFFTMTDGDRVVNLPQAIIMIIALVFTVLYQWQLNVSFRPLFRYLPITLEDEAVLRDEQFAKAQASKFAPLNHDEDADQEQDYEHTLEQHEREEREADRRVENKEKLEIARRASQTERKGSTPGSIQRSWHKRDAKPDWKTNAWKKAAPEAVARLRYLADGKPVKSRHHTHHDHEAQHTVGDVLFGGFADELEDLTPDERDILVRYAFQHTALRARRPVVWIPRDRLGVSDDEIKRAQKMSSVRIDGQVRTHIWMSNDGTALDGKGRVVFRKSPPDFSNVDLIAL